MPLDARRASLGAVRASAVRECRGVPSGPLAAAAVAASAPRGPEPGSPGALTPPPPASGAPRGVRGPRSLPGLSGPPPDPLPAAVRRVPVAPSARGRDRRLTVREIEVLDLASRGLADPQIARGLGLSQRTIREHLTRLYSKLEVRNRAAAVAAGFRLGLLAPGPAAVVGAPSLKPRLAPLLLLIAVGMRDEEIAAERSSTLPVVRYRVRELRKALGAVSREHAVRLAVEGGLLVVSPDGMQLVLADSATGGAS